MRSNEKETVVVRDGDSGGSGVGWAVAVIVLVFAIGFGFVAFSNQQSMHDMQSAQMLDEMGDRAANFADKATPDSTSFNIEAPEVEAPQIEAPKVENPVD